MAQNHRYFQLGKEKVIDMKNRKWISKTIALALTLALMMPVTVMAEEQTQTQEQSQQAQQQSTEQLPVFSYEGDGNFDIFGMNMAKMAYQVLAVSEDANGYFGLIYSNAVEETSVLVNAIGAYQGVSIIPQGDNASSLHIIASGHWKLLAAPIVEPTVSDFEGSGNKVSGRFKGDGKMHDVYLANYATKGNFIVWLYDLNDNTKVLLANGTRTFGKTKKDIYLGENHSYVVSVKSTGTWKVDFLDRE